MRATQSGGEELKCPLRILPWHTVRYSLVASRVFFGELKLPFSIQSVGSTESSTVPGLGHPLHQIEREVEVDPVVDMFGGVPFARGILVVELVLFQAFLSTTTATMYNR